MGLDLILYWKMRNYRKVILLNLKMLFCVWWPIFCYHKRHSIVQNLFQKLSIFKTESSSSKVWDSQWRNFQCNTCFYCFDLVASFSNYKNTSMLWFYFHYFFFFYSHQCPCLNFCVSWVNFLKTRIIVYFSISWFDFPMVA